MIFSIIPTVIPDQAMATNTMQSAQPLAQTGNGSMLTPFTILT
ncbi:MAG: hypothetical protein ACPHW3_05340 [Candidatus Puniceispirillales bacterium]